MNFTFAEPVPSVEEDDAPDPYAMKYSKSWVRPDGQEDRSMESSALLDRQSYESYDNINNKKWTFEEKEVTLLKQDVLGRGNFGQVFVGTWRGSLVACKCLHDSTVIPRGQMISVDLREHKGDRIGCSKIKSIEQQRMESKANRLQKKELEVLTRLRHPNLVQFMGICCHPKDHLQPTIILTELMSYSLYDALEIRRYELDLPEILDVVSDVASGLNYLHSCTPMIVHKNLSSKNILFSGKIAKLADFGLSGQDGGKHYTNLIGKASSGKTVVGARPVTAVAKAATVISDGSIGKSMSVLNFRDGAVDEGKEGSVRTGVEGASGLIQGSDSSDRVVCEEATGGYVDTVLGVTFPETVSSSTLPFLAPEIIGGTKYKLTEKIDVYSLGMVLLHMLSGRLPSTNQEEREAQVRKVTLVVKSLSKKEIAAKSREDIMNIDSSLDEADMPSPDKRESEKEYVSTSLGKIAADAKMKPRIGNLQHQVVPIYSADPPGTTRGAVLSTILNRLADTMPVSRPSCEEVLRMMEDLKFNDRYYPLDRRRPNPKSELGPSIRRWVREEQERENQMTTLRLHQMRALLQAEGNRWLVEGKVSDFLQEQLSHTSSELMTISNQKNGLELELRDTLEKLRAVTEELRIMKEKNENITRGLLRDKQCLSDKVLDLDMNLKACIGDYHAAVTALDETTERLAMRDNAVIGMGGNLRQKDTEMNHLRARYDALDNENSELEVRLEQALERWKQSHEILEKEQKSFKRLSNQSASIVEKNKHLEDERERLIELVRRQEGEVLPDDVLRKIAGLEQELINSAKANEKLIEQKQELSLNIDDLENRVLGLEEELTTSQNLAKNRQTTVDARDAEIMEMKEDMQMTEEQNTKVLDEYSEREAGLKMKITKLEEWVDSLQKKIAEGGNRNGDEKPEGRGVDSNHALENEQVETEGGENDAEIALEDEEGSLEGMEVGSGVRSAPKHFADAVKAKIQTRQNLAQIHANNKDRKEKERKAAIRAADSMAKARVRQYEIQESGTGEAFTGMIGMLRESVTDVHICWRSCRALRPLLLHNGQLPQSNSLSPPKKAVADFKDIAITQQTDLACVDVLRHFSGTRGDSHLEALAKGQAVQLLGVVAFGCDLVRRRAGENGALALIVKVMEFHGAFDEKNLLHCLTTVTNLTHNNQDNRHRFIDAGGLEVLSDCMEAHIGSAKVQRQGCWALLTLAGSDETARLVAQGGGSRTLMTLVSALLTHPQDSGVQQFGLWATSNMALAGGDISRRLRKAGLPEICRIAIESHPKDVEVLRQARHATGILQAK